MLIFGNEKVQGQTFYFSLLEAIKYSQENSILAQQANNYLKKAKYNTKIAFSIGLPQIAIQTDYNNFIKQSVSLIPSEIFGGTPGSYREIIFGTKQSLSATATLNQLIIDGSYIVGLKYAKTYLRLSNEQKRKINQTIRQSIISAYVQVLIARENIRVIKKNIYESNKSVQEISETFKEGLTEEENVEQVLLGLETLKSELVRAQQVEKMSYLSLKNILGVPINAQVELTDSIDKLVLNSLEKQTEMTFIATKQLW